MWVSSAALWGVEDSICLGGNPIIPDSKMFIGGNPMAPDSMTGIPGSDSE
jgi:hypothetical protein